MEKLHHFPNLCTGKRVEKKNLNSSLFSWFELEQGSFLSDRPESGCSVYYRKRFHSITTINFYLAIVRGCKRTTALPKATKKGLQAPHPRAWVALGEWKIVLISSHQWIKYAAPHASCVSRTCWAKNFHTAHRGFFLSGATNPEVEKGKKRKSIQHKICNIIRATMMQCLYTRVPVQWVPFEEYCSN